MSNNPDHFETDKLARLLTRHKTSQNSVHVAREIIKTGRRVTSLSDEDVNHAMSSDVAEVLKAPLQSGLEKLRHGRDSSLSADEFIALESVVVLDGIRPSLRFSQQQLETNKKLGEWADVTLAAKGQIEHVAKSVGRVNLGARQMGTGFMVSDELFMTNRHVLQGIARFDGDAWTINADVKICFDDEGCDGSAMGVDDHVITSSQDIDASALDFSKSDYALIRLKGRELPAALTLETSVSDVITSRPIYTIGFPGKPMPGTERFSLLKDIFDFDFGVKRYAPGEVEGDMSTFAEHGATSVFGHDCTTLGGCSGSPIIDLGDTNARVVGVHFSGQKRVSNYAHSMAALRNELDDQGLNYGS